MGGSNKPGSSPYEAALSRIAKDIWKKTSPSREGFYADWANIMEGGTPQFADTMFAGMRRPIEAQYGAAKQGVLAGTPAGGGLVDALSQVETGRAEGMANILNQIWQDQINKMYGAAFNAPGQAMQGLGSAASSYANRYGSQAARAGGFEQGLMSMTGQLGSAGAAACCFNFLEAEGEIYWTVRRYRDQHYRKDGRVSMGYIRSARILVPLMQRYSWFKSIVRFVMTRPLRAYASWRYHENAYGFIFWPLAKSWVNLWRILGIGR